MQCSVFRHKRKVNGRLRIGRTYSGRFKLAGEMKATTIPLGTTDKQLAQQKLLMAVREREKELAGGGRKPLREAAQSPLLSHLSDFLADLRARKRSESHVRHLETRIKRLFAECHWEHLRDVGADGFMLWRAKQTEFSQKTIHEYKNAAFSLFAWMERHDRLENNPLRRVGNVERKGYEKVRRRSFTHEEMARLLAVAGPYALGYLAAVNTGLRRKELCSVQWGDVHLDTASPFIMVRSCTTKNRKAGKIYLKSQLARMLKEIKPESGMADELVFASRIAPLRKIHQHLKAAGIPACNEQGEKVDFHALRKTYNTNLELVGASLQVRQELLRHSDPRLTAGTYMDTTRLETASLIEKLPDFLGEKLDCTQLRTQATVSASPDVAQAVTANRDAECAETLANKGDSHALSLAVATGHIGQQTGALGFESPPLRHLTAHAQT
jgi:integrase